MLREEGSANSTPAVGFPSVNPNDDDVAANVNVSDLLRTRPHAHAHCS